MCSDNESCIEIIAFDNKQWQRLNGESRRRGKCKQKQLIQLGIQTLYKIKTTPTAENINNTQNLSVVWRHRHVRQQLKLQSLQAQYCLAKQHTKRILRRQRFQWLSQSKTAKTTITTKQQTKNTNGTSKRA